MSNSERKWLYAVAKPRYSNVSQMAVLIQNNAKVISEGERFFLLSTKIPSIKLRMAQKLNKIVIKGDIVCISLFYTNIFFSIKKVFSKFFLTIQK